MFEVMNVRVMNVGHSLSSGGGLQNRDENDDESEDQDENENYDYCGQ